MNNGESVQSNFNRFTTRLAAAGLAAGLMLGACSNDGNETTEIPAVSIETGTGSEADGTPESTTSETKDLIDNIFNTTAAEMQAFSCVDEDNEQYGIKISVHEGTKFVEQILPHKDLTVESSARDFFHRDDSDSVDAPFTVDVGNKELTHEELSARMCANPTLLAGTLHQWANSKVNGLTIGENAPMLERFVGKTEDEVSAMMTNPYNQEQVSPEQFERNFARNIERQEYAEYVVSVLENLQKLGLLQDVQLFTNYALTADTVFNPLEPATFEARAYTGDMIAYGFTQKGNDCIKLHFGFNAGTTNPEDEGGDKRPVVAIEELDCKVADVPPTGDTLPPTGTIPEPDKNPVRPSGANIDPSAGGPAEEGDAVDDNGSGYGNGDTKPSHPATSEVPEVTADTVPATTGELVDGDQIDANGANSDVSGDNSDPALNVDPTQGGVGGDTGAPQD